MFWVLLGDRTPLEMSLEVNLASLYNFIHLKAPDAVIFRTLASNVTFIKCIFQPLYVVSLCSLFLAVSRA